jgi:regulator of nucleoside diphosphate kinase
MILTTSDRERIIRLLRASKSPSVSGTIRAGLNAGVTTATVVEPTDMPPSVVTMNSIVKLIDIETGEIATYALVYPADANVDRLRISVLAPLGAALLGRSEGEVIEYEVPGGTKRFYLQKVVEQPEARRRASMSDA